MRGGGTEKEKEKEEKEKKENQEKTSDAGHNIIADRWVEMRKIAFCFHLTDYNSNIRFNCLLVNVKSAFIISVACYATLQPAMSVHRLVG